MNAADRAAYYFSQTGRARLTPAQRRRLRKKNNQHPQQIQRKLDQIEAKVVNNG